MQNAPRIDDVIYDSALKRFHARVALNDGPGVAVSAPGRDSWSHDRIVRAILEKARDQHRALEARHARA